MPKKPVNNINIISIKKSHNIYNLIEWGLIVIGLFILFFYLPHSIYGDGAYRFQALSRLFETGQLSNFKYSLIGPLFSSPLWWLGKIFKDSVWWCARYNYFVFVFGLLAFYLLMRKKIPGGIIRKFILILMIGSMFPNHLRTYYGEVFTAILVAVGLLVVAFKDSIKGWLAVIIGVVNTPASLVGLALVIIKRCLQSKHIRYVLVILSTILVMAVEFWIRQGSPFLSGYQGDYGTVNPFQPYSGLPGSGFSYPFLFGLMSIFLSFGRGILFFAPGILLLVSNNLKLISRRLYNGYIFWLIFLLGLILVYAKWHAWHGAWFWGPRFFLFASIPASLALAVALWRPFRSLAGKIFILIILYLSIWVGLNGAIFDQANLEICYYNHYLFHHLCWYLPEFSALWRPFVVLDQLDLTQWVFILYAGLVAIYLSCPILTCVAREMIEKYKEIRFKYFDLKKWKF